MSGERPDLRLEAPVLEPSDELIRRLAATARSGRAVVPQRRHRFAVVAASFLGVSAISVGGAWAVGAIDVPGVPTSPLKHVEVAPDRPSPQGQPGPDPSLRGGGGPGDEPPSRVGDPGPASDGGQFAEDRDPVVEEPPVQGTPDAAPKELEPAQGDSRPEDRGDNGGHRGQGKDKGNGKGRGDADAGAGKTRPDDGGRPRADKNPKDPPGRDRAADRGAVERGSDDG